MQLFDLSPPSYFVLSLQIYLHLFSFLYVLFSIPASLSSLIPSLVEPSKKANRSIATDTK